MIRAGEVRNALLYYRSVKLEVGYRRAYWMTIRAYGWGHWRNLAWRRLQERQMRLAIGE